MSDGLTPTLITVSVTAVGWYATYAYAKRAENRTRRAEIQLKYRAQQIEELYGPLLSLIEQVFNVWEVRETILKGGNYSDAVQKSIGEFFWQRYFSPLHKEIGELLRTRLYLLENSHLPKSFGEYLQHATQEACQHQLWDELKIDTSHVPGRKWPRQFDQDVKKTLDSLMEQYKSGLARLS
jgi:hypothetical protein